MAEISGKILTQNIEQEVYAGYSEGYAQAAEIYANLKEGETIKVAIHSMGGAYGKGFIKGLKTYAKEHDLDARIEWSCYPFFA